ncbi:MAG: sensor histidine kinase [Spirulinaceae cyanobacterium]
MTSFWRKLYRGWQALPIRIRGTIIVAIPITYLFTALSAFVWLKASLAEDEAWVQHTQTVRLESQRLLNALLDAETGVRGYGLTQRREFLEPYKNAQLVIPDSLSRLENLVQDNPPQVQQIQNIRGRVDENLTIFQKKLLLQQELQRIKGTNDVLVPAASLYDWLEEGKASMDTTREEIEQFAETEEDLLVQRIQHRDSWRQITWIVLCLAGAIATLSAWLAIHLFYQLERELAHRELNLQESNRRLENACDQLQRFTANASHELRAPLAAVLSNAQVGLMDLDDFEEEESTGDLRQRLEKVVAIAKQMSTLVGDLLFLARNEGLLAPGSLQPLELNQFIRDLAQEFLSQAQTQGLKFILTVPDDKININADRNLLGQAIANLLSNAYRYTPSGGKIELRLIHTPTQACIQVIDTGVGIPETAISHIFERFYRVDPKRSRASGGFGLGLAIVQQIVHLHGGKINIMSKVKRGSTFEILLPMG